MTSGLATVVGPPKGEWSSQKERGARMKGIVFTEFLEMVEHQFGPAIADRIIVESKVASNGAYTSVGTYDHGELVAMVVCLSAATGVPAEALVQAFGEHLFERFAVGFPQFF